MAYEDLDTIHNPATGTIPPASWGDQIRDNFEFLIDPPACSVFNSALQSVADTVVATAVALTANSENYDNAGMHSTSSNTSRITCQTAGRYMVQAQVEYAANTTGIRYMGFEVNGTTRYDGMLTSGQGSNTIRHSATRTITLEVDDYVECVVAQASGGALNIKLDEFAVLFFTR